jgi:hypothetical protein
VSRPRQLANRRRPATKRPRGRRARVRTFAPRAAAAAEAQRARLQHGRRHRHGDRGDRRRLNMRHLLKAGTALALAVMVTAVAGRTPAVAGEPDCAQALAAVDARTAAVIASRRDDAAAAGRPDPRLLSLRRSAARACLGAQAEGRAAAPLTPTQRAPAHALDLVPPGPAADGPASLGSALSRRPDPAPGTGPALQAAPLLPAAPVPGSGPPRSQAPLGATACDPGGCWASDGTRLQRVGPQLLGPRGFCSLQGGLLHCP